MAEAQRFLRSKRLRAALWLAANGKCQRCGVELSEGWHADHVEPWCETKRTNVHEMQALCATCNLRKGARHMDLRKHQLEAQTWARNIVLAHSQGRLVPSKLVIDAIPGSGKSACVPLMFDELFAGGVVKRLLWLAPRDSLVSQAVGAFAKWTRARHKIKSAGVERIVPPDYCGAVATYQAACASRVSTLLEYVRGDRTMVVFDEAAWVADEETRTWAAVTQRLFDAAHVRVVMSGTLFRARKTERVRFVDYVATDPSGAPLEHGHLRPRADISCSIQDALEGRMIIVPRFRLANGHVKYERIVNGESTEHTYDLDEEVPEEEGRKLDVFLSDDGVWRQILDEAVEHWREWRKENERSRMIVVAASVAHARTLTQYLRKIGLRAELSVAEDGDSTSILSAFREERHGDVLVTVAKAHIGFDAPDVDHLVYLSRARSLPWVVQVFGRAWRHDHESAMPWLRQRAHIFVPNDVRMRRIVEWFEKQIPQTVREKIERAESSTDRGAGVDPDVVVPRDAGVDTWEHADTKGFVDADAVAVAEDLLRVHPEWKPVVDGLDLARAFEQYERRAPQRKATSNDANPEKRRESLREKLDGLIKHYAMLKGQALGEPPDYRAANLEVNKMFGWFKRAEEATDADLERAIPIVAQWVEELRSRAS